MFVVNLFGDNSLYPVQEWWLIQGLSGNGARQNFQIFYKLKLKKKWLSESKVVWFVL